MGPKTDPAVRKLGIKKMVHKAETNKLDFINFLKLCSIHRRQKLTECIYIPHVWQKFTCTLVKISKLDSKLKQMQIIVPKNHKTNALSCCISGHG